MSDKPQLTIDGTPYPILDNRHDWFRGSGLSQQLVDAFFSSQILNADAYGHRFPVLVTAVNRQEDWFELSVRGEPVAV